MSSGNLKLVSMKESKIVYTGPSGFVAENLRSYLAAAGYNDLLPLSLRTGSLRSSVTGIGAVIHLAGKAHDLKKVSAPEEYYQVNYELTKKLYDEFLESDAVKFIFVSSVKAAADSVEGTLTEQDIPDPKTDYGKSKLMAENYILSQPLPEGKSYFILRPCMIHGPGNKGNLNLLYQFVKKGVPYPLAAFENKRSFLSIANLCFVIKELLEREIPSGIYNLADDESLSTNELVTTIAGALGRKPRLWRIPSPAVKMLAKLGDKLKLPLNSERLQKLTENYVVSNRKITGALGRQLPYSSREGLRRTILSFRAG